MVWKINKHKKSDKQGKIRRQKKILDSQPKLKSCLKTKKNTNKHNDDSLEDSSRFIDDPNYAKNREQSTKSGTSRGARSSGSNFSHGIESNGARSSGSNFSHGIESKGSANSPSLGFANKKRVASIEQHSVSSRSWDRESRKSETAVSTQGSERSSVGSRSRVEAPKKKVHFSSIHIRDYERVVGDNPSCTIGPPVGIGWKYGESRVITIDSFEASKSYKKSTSHMILSREEREALLLNWGASFHDIIESVRSNLKIKNQRRQTVTNLGKIERIEEAFESATRKLKSALLLRRSTGNQVKRLQEQASLAQSALTSLKMAEDRALSEIRGTSHIEMVEEPKSQEAFNSYPLTNYGPSSSQGVESDDQSSRRISLGNSTSPSESEIERFYRELELEMFGDEELPSMVGQTLEVQLENGDRNLKIEESSVTSGITDRYSKEELDDELLEKEQNRSMISEYLLMEAVDNEPRKFDTSPHGHGEHDDNNFFSPTQLRNPLHTGEIVPRNDFERYSTSQLDPSPIPHAIRATRGMEFQEPHYMRQQTIPLHAGMTMFEDCALLGGQNGASSYREGNRHLSRKKDLNAGPKVRFIPPPNHFSPSQWMDGSDAHGTPSREHETITICEDDFGERRHFFEQYNHAYSNGAFYSNIH